MPYQTQRKQAEKRPQRHGGAFLGAPPRAVFVFPTDYVESPLIVDGGDVIQNRDSVPP